MTIKELREKLAEFPDDKEVELLIEDIVDDWGTLINGRSKVENIYYGLNGSVELSGFDLYS